MSGVFVFPIVWRIGDGYICLTEHGTREEPTMQTIFRQAMNHFEKTGNGPESFAIASRDEWINPDLTMEDWVVFATDVLRKEAALKASQEAWERSPLFKD